MFEKNMKLAYLLDFYGEALDERTNSIMQAYYDDDLSLSEIADGEGISRQGVRHIIKKGEDQLEFLEEKLGLAAHYSELELAVEKLKLVLQSLKDGNDARGSEKLIQEVITTILNKGF
jgi:predicted DNA-binding protein YlxM (UPF0122 family)